MKRKSFLIAGGAVSALIAVLHIILAVDPALYAMISAGQSSGLSQMAEQNPGVTSAITFVLALIFVIWSLYAFSAAGVIGRLPLLHPAVIAITAIYLLRSLFVISEIQMVFREDYPFRFVIYSTISLAAGLLYLIGQLEPRRG
jgi:hypothetical protein